MDCPHHIVVKPIPVQSTVSVKLHLKWLKDQEITRYRWAWKDKKSSAWHMRIDHIQYDWDCTHILLFRFESEKDKAHFALRWA